MEIDDTKKKHIMFSYSWKQKGRVRHIYDIIEENFPCIPKWIDINEMQGNIIESMTDAVENSFLVIVFLSKDYKNSKNCKTESELIIGKQKKYLIVLLDQNFPFLDENEKDNWISKTFNNQFYIDLDDLDHDNLCKLIELVSKEISSYYNFNKINDNKLYNRRPSFSANNIDHSFVLKKKNSKNTITSKYSPLKNQSVRNNLSKNDSNELDNFILNNNLNQNDIDNIKDLVVKTPRTMVPTLKAEGLSFKGILNIINDIKNEDSFRESNYDDTDYT
jgi:hypothetical protein